MCYADTVAATVCYLFWEQEVSYFIRRSLLHPTPCRGTPKRKENYNKVLSRYSRSSPPSPIESAAAQPSSAEKEEASQGRKLRPIPRINEEASLFEYRSVAHLNWCALLPLNAPTDNKLSTLCREDMDLSPFPSMAESIRRKQRTQRGSKDTDPYAQIDGQHTSQELHQELHSSPPQPPEEPRRDKSTVSWLITATNREAELL